MIPGRGTKLERARRIQQLALRFMHRNGHWALLYNGREAPNTKMTDC